jgi:hypothetical protein
MRFSFLINRRRVLLVNEALAANHPTSLTGRDPFLLMSYSFLINWKGFLPIDEEAKPHQLEGIHSG